MSQDDDPAPSQDDDPAPTTPRSERAEAREERADMRELEAGFPPGPRRNRAVSRALRADMRRLESDIEATETLMREMDADQAARDQDVKEHKRIIQSILAAWSDCFYYNRLFLEALYHDVASDDETTR